MEPTSLLQQPADSNPIAQYNRFRYLHLPSYLYLPLWCYQIIPLVSARNKTCHLWATLHHYLVQVGVRRADRIFWFYGFVFFSFLPKTVAQASFIFFWLLTTEKSY